MDEGYVWERENLPFERTLDGCRFICLLQQQLRMDLSVLHESNLEQGEKARRPVVVQEKNIFRNKLKLNIRMFQSFVESENLENG